MQKGAEFELGKCGDGKEMSYNTSGWLKQRSRSGRHAHILSNQTGCYRKKEAVASETWPSLCASC